MLPIIAGHQFKQSAVVTYQILRSVPEITFVSAQVRRGSGFMPQPEPYIARGVPCRADRSLCHGCAQRLYQTLLPVTQFSRA